MVALTRFVALESVSIADALTATNIQLGVPAARGIQIPVSEHAGSTTLAFYFRNDQGYSQQAGGTIVDARATLNSLLGYTDQGAITSVLSRYFIDGFDVSGYSSNVVLANSALTKWQLFVIRFENIPRQAGTLNFFMDALGHAPYPVKFADVRLYDYTLSLAQISAPLLPFDYVTRYTFAGYAPGDTVVTDVSGHANHGTLYF
jgi:hypothetical protein